jgi:alkylation response protein AidB-like acyl-CoA dehydrogenase
MTIPTQFGGQGRSLLDRYVVIEELLAAGAPVAAHWVGDRQVAPALMRYGSDALKERFLPAIAAGESSWAIGLSEPDAGSDLAAVRTRARRADDGWLLSGRKVWSSGAHLADAMFVLARTSPPRDNDRHHGLTQFLLEFATTGVQINPIRLLTGEHHFNEVVLDDVHVSDDLVVGEVDSGWRQATIELAYERSGPERFLSTLPLLRALSHADSGAAELTDHLAGQLITRLWALRGLSLGVAQALETGAQVDATAALVKDVGTRFESAVIDTARLLTGAEPEIDRAGLSGMLADAILHAPGFTLRGGTNEILRGVVARALGLR